MQYFLVSLFKVRITEPENPGLTAGTEDSNDNDLASQAAQAHAEHGANGQTEHEVSKPDQAEPGSLIVDQSPSAGTDAAFYETTSEAEVTSAERTLPGGLSKGVSLSIALTCSLFVFGLLNWPVSGDLFKPLLFLETTPSGGDMGAHVWGPAFMRDYLIPQGRLSGWSPDWYSGFPAYNFYMILPSLLIVMLNVGFVWYLGLPLAVAAVFAAYWYKETIQTKTRVPSFAYWVLASLLAVLLIGLSYGVAFKLVTVLGLVTFPVAAWYMGRLAKAPEPIPAFLSLGAFIFLFDTNFSITGGNVLSTLAGEFAFSISLMLVLLAIGFTMKGMDEDIWRARSAVVIALVVLCHLLPMFFMVPALFLLILAGQKTSRVWILAGIAALAMLPMALRDDASLGLQIMVIAIVVLVFAMAIIQDKHCLRRAQWLAMSSPVAVLLASFWLFPFYFNEAFFNDMGWNRLEEYGPKILTPPMQVAIIIVVISFFVSLLTREKVGILFGGMALFAFSAVANLGEGPLWNERLLPFFYLSVYLGAAAGLGMMVRILASLEKLDLRRPNSKFVMSASGVALAATFVGVLLPLHMLPFGQTGDDGVYRVSIFGNTLLKNDSKSSAASWAAWNYTGYERKDSYREYHGVVQLMSDIGSDPQHGCGRAMWEYSKELERYGTPMALMLLPHWTDGCIGSMEGVYFESSSTTPFHFLNQSALSEEGSRAQSHVPYEDFNIETGIEQLKLTGVRYYMAQTDLAVEQADAHPELTKIGESQPFSVYKVAGSDLVESLTVEPIVVSGRSEAQAQTDEDPTRFDYGWLSESVKHYSSAGDFAALPVEDGPEQGLEVDGVLIDWLSKESLDQDDGEAIEPVTVSNVETTSNRIRFTVDEIGKPIYVKASYFPNWEADGAKGPWRAGPNMMVVIPTETIVELNYGRSNLDIFATFLTLLGVVAAIALARADGLGKSSNFLERALKLGTASQPTLAMSGSGQLLLEEPVQQAPPAPVVADAEPPPPLEPAQAGETDPNIPAPPVSWTQTLSASESGNELEKNGFGSETDSESLSDNARSDNSAEPDLES